MDTLKDRKNYPKTTLQCIRDAGFDTIVYCGVTYTAHSLIDTAYFTNLRPSDVFTFFVIDGLFCVFISPKLVGWLKMEDINKLSYGDWFKWFGLKYGALTLAVLGMDLIVGKSGSAMLGTLVNIGLTSAVAEGSKTILMHNSKSPTVAESLS
jgi:hypothetical protein